MTLPDTDSFLSFGGPKINYSAPVNPNTDYDATLLNSAFCDVAEMTRVSTRFWVRFTGASTTGGLLLIDWDSNWKGSINTAPTLSRVGTGTYTITTQTVVTDENGGNHTVNFRRPQNVVFEGSVPYVGNVSLTSPNVLTLYTFNSVGTGVDISAVNVNVAVQ
jgi:hypothetical protein